VRILKKQLEYLRQVIACKNVDEMGRGGSEVAGEAKHVSRTSSKFPWRSAPSTTTPQYTLAYHADDASCKIDDAI
jgi:hypothetical protein